MKEHKRKLLMILAVLLMSTMVIHGAGAPEETMSMRSIMDSYGREVEIPEQVDTIICSSSGALRLAAYLQVLDRVVAVDDMEGRRSAFQARPYALAHPELADLPLFGVFRGDDSPELILGLDPQPQVVFKTYPERGVAPDELTAKTGIPVVSLSYGDILTGREDFYTSLRIMGEALGVSERAEAVILFFDEHIEDLQTRCEGVSDLSCYIGGVAKQGLRGITSTEVSYPPFMFTGANQVMDVEEHTSHAMISKEQLVGWDPDIIFIDVSSLLLEDTSNVLYELQNRTYYQDMKSVKNGRVYGLLPYNLYSGNYGSILADAYFIGSILNPESFSDIDPVKKADEIYEFLVGAPVFDKMDDSLGNTVFTRIAL